MYICVCNALTEKRISEALAEDSSVPLTSVYERFGVSPRCGKCAANLRALMRRNTGSAPSPAAAE